MLVTCITIVLHAKKKKKKKKNQSIVQQFTKLGNILTLFLNASPIGEKAKTMCRLLLHLSTKKAYS